MSNENPAQKVKLRLWQRLQLTRRQDCARQPLPEHSTRGARLSRTTLVLCRGQTPYLTRFLLETAIPERTPLLHPVPAANSSGCRRVASGRKVEVEVSPTRGAGWQRGPSCVGLSRCWGEPHSRARGGCHELNGIMLEELGFSGCSSNSAHCQ